VFVYEAIRYLQNPMLIITQYFIPHLRIAEDNMLENRFGVRRNIMIGFVTQLPLAFDNQHSVLELLSSRDRSIHSKVYMVYSFDDEI